MIDDECIDAAEQLHELLIQNEVLTQEEIDTFLQQLEEEEQEEEFY